MGARGHLFVVKADMLQLDCDALLIPVGPEFEFAYTWTDFLQLRSWRDLEPSAAWSDGEIVRRIAPTPPGGREVYAGCVAVPFGSRATEVEAIEIATRAAVEFVRIAASDVAPAPHRDGGPPRLAVPMVGTGFGGLGGVVGDVVRPLVEGLQSAAIEHGVDVVLCTIRESDWSAVQWLRSSAPAEETWALSSSLLRRAERVADHAREGNLVLFMGAGVGKDVGLPDWKELLRKLAADIGMTDAEIEALNELDPRDVARLIERRAEDRVPEFNLRDAVADALGAECFGLSHALLSSVGVQSAVTTNYDSLYERAAQLPLSVDSGPRRLPYEPITSNASWVLKLHGDLAEGDVVITRSDYLGLARHRSALFGVVQALLMTRHLLFVGYSMKDDDFHSLVDEIESALGPGSARDLGTALVLEASPTAELWKELVDIEVVKGSGESTAARNLLLLLDRVACLAADHSSHLLDGRYTGLFTDEELRVAEQLSEVLAVAQALPLGSIARTELEALRVRLGGASS